MAKKPETVANNLENIEKENKKEKTLTVDEFSKNFLEDLKKKKPSESAKDRLARIREDKKKRKNDFLEKNKEAIIKAIKLGITKKDIVDSLNNGMKEDKSFKFYPADLKDFKIRETNDGNESDTQENV